MTRFTINNTPCGRTRQKFLWQVGGFTLGCLFFLPPPRPGADDKIMADVVYGRKDGMALTFDVLRPAKPNGAAILWIPTGGWVSPWFDAKFAAVVSKPILDRGFTVFVIRHSCSPKYAIPDCTADVRLSVRFIRMKAKEFGIDPERLGVWGASAGGHLSLMLGTTGDDGDKKAKDEAPGTAAGWRRWSQCARRRTSATG